MQWACLRGSHVFQHRASSPGILTSRGNRTGKQGYRLDGFRKRAEHVYSRQTDELTHLLKAKLALAFGDETSDRHARTRNNDLVADRFKDIPSLKQSLQIGSAWTGGIT